MFSEIRVYKGRAVKHSTGHSRYPQGSRNVVSVYIVHSPRPPPPPPASIEPPMSATERLLSHKNMFYRVPRQFESVAPLIINECCGIVPRSIDTRCQGERGCQKFLALKLSEDAVGLDIECIACCIGKDLPNV